MRAIIPYIYNKISSVCYRYRLRNKDFTIITNTCIGGVMYHKLGKQFLSPTINLWMHDKDFLRFIGNLKEYISKDLIFVDGIDDTPTAWCGDVLIHFNHAHSQQEAMEAWNKRRVRINYDNLFVIMSDRPGSDTIKDGNQEITQDDILSLSKLDCRGKVIFSVRKYDNIDYIVPLPKDPDGEFVNVYMFDKSKCTKRWRWESAWDWVHWLNTGEVRVKR